LKESLKVPIVQEGETKVANIILMKLPMRANVVGFNLSQYDVTPDEEENTGKSSTVKLEKSWVVEIEAYVNHRIEVGWLKWRIASCVFM
jgi:hypothetical protein